MPEEQIAELIAEQKRTNDLLAALCENVKFLSDDLRLTRSLSLYESAESMQRCPPTPSEPD